MLKVRRRQIEMNTKKAFSLIEVMIVVAILGILAAIILPDLRGHTQKAKETAAEDNLRILRNTIEIYAAQHNDVPPGYAGGDTSKAPSPLQFVMQIGMQTDKSGNIKPGPDAVGYNLGPYLGKTPTNLFNGRWTITFIGDNENFPNDAPDSGGWVYKPATKIVKIDYPGTDSQGVRYYDY